MVPVSPRFRAEAPFLRTLALYAWQDDGLAQLMRALESRGLRDDTLLLALADHGAYQKGTVHGASRVPFVLQWPQRIRPGQLLDTLVGVHDIAPTLLHAAGDDSWQRRGFDGVSLLPLLLAPLDAPHGKARPAWRRRGILLEMCRQRATVSAQGWRLVSTIVDAHTARKFNCSFVRVGTHGASALVRSCSHPASVARSELLAADAPLTHGPIVPWMLLGRACESLAAGGTGHEATTTSQVADLRHYFSSWLGVVDALDTSLGADQLYDMRADPLGSRVRSLHECPRELLCMKALYASLLSTHSDAPLQHSHNVSSLAAYAYGVGPAALSGLDGWERTAEALNCSEEVWEGPGWCRDQTGRADATEGLQTFARSPRSLA